MSHFGLLHYLHFAWKLVKASVEAFTASMEASMEDMEAMGDSMEASVEAMEAVEASVEDMEDIYERFHGRNFHGSYHESL